MKRAWHFVGDKLRGGRDIPRNGAWLEHKVPVQICQTGLHASYDPFDALQFAPGSTLCLVDVDGIVTEQSDKLVCTRRRIVARMDATEMLRYFARMQALSVIHLYDDAPDVVLDYLMTGDEKIWDAAKAASRAAARAAAWAAAMDAARAAALHAAWGAARQDFNELVRDCFWQFL